MYSLENSTKCWWGWKLWCKTHNYILISCGSAPSHLCYSEIYFSGIKPVYKTLSPRQHCQAQSIRVLRCEDGTKSSHLSPGEK